MIFFFFFFVIECRQNVQKKKKEKKKMKISLRSNLYIENFLCQKFIAFSWFIVSMKIAFTVKIEWIKKKNQNLIRNSLILYTFSTFLHNHPHLNYIILYDMSSIFFYREYYFRPHNFIKLLYKKMLEIKCV